MAAIFEGAASVTFASAGHFHTIAKKTEDLKNFTTCLNSCEGRRFVCVVNCVTFQLVALVNSSDRPTVYSCPLKSTTIK